MVSIGKKEDGGEGSLIFALVQFTETPVDFAINYQNDAIQEIIIIKKLAKILAHWPLPAGHCLPALTPTISYLILSEILIDDRRRVREREREGQVRGVKPACPGSKYSEGAWVILMSCECVCNVGKHCMRTICNGYANECAAGGIVWNRY